MLSQKQYAVLTAKNAPKSHTAVCCVRAFFIGGSICAAGQGLLTLYGALGFDELNARTLTSVTLIFFGVLLTALGPRTPFPRPRSNSAAKGLSPEWARKCSPLPVPSSSTAVLPPRSTARYSGYCTFSA